MMLKEPAYLVRAFVFLMVGIVLLFVVLGAVLLVLKPNVTISSMSGAASSISKSFFVDMLSMEIPLLHESDSDTYNTFSSKNTANFMIKFLLDVDPTDAKSLLAATIPAINYQRPIVLYKGDALSHDDYPIDYAPTPETLQPEEFAPESEANGGTLENDTVPEATVNPPVKENPDPDPDLNPDPNPPNNPPVNMSVKPRIFIYHTHNRESWLPELPKVKEAYLAFDSKINVTLLGERLAEKLQDKGIVTLHSTTDYPSVYKKDYPNYTYYNYSKTTVKEALATSPGLKFLIDIHRDSGPRKSTTITIDGKEHAQVYFVVGLENPHWKENNEFAIKIHNALNEKYPGISKGIYGKDHHEGNGKYNQELFPHSCLIEVGGVENTIEESNRTIDILADVISEIYSHTEQAEEVMAQPAT